MSNTSTLATQVIHWWDYNWGWVVAGFVLFGPSVVEFFQGLARRRQAAPTLEDVLDEVVKHITDERESTAYLLPSSKPGPCTHRRVQPIIPRGEDRPVGWICLKPGCEKRLPADWATESEDL